MGGLWNLQGVVSERSVAFKREDKSLADLVMVWQRERERGGFETEQSVPHSLKNQMLQKVERVNESGKTKVHGSVSDKYGTKKEPMSWCSEILYG